MNWKICSNEKLSKWVLYPNFKSEWENNKENFSHSIGNEIGVKLKWNFYGELFRNVLNAIGDETNEITFLNELSWEIYMWKI